MAKRRIVVLLGLLCSLFTIPANADVLDQIAKEGGRALDKAVARRITHSVVKGLTDETELDNSVWGTFIYTRIDDGDLSDLETDDTSIDFGVDMFQYIFGADKSVGDFLFGVSGGYIHVEFFAESSDDDPDENTVNNLDAGSFSPYFAYSFNDNVFLTGLMNYTYTGSHTIDDVHIVNTELAANGLFVIQDFVFKGKVGHRYTYLDASFEDTSDTFDFYVNSVVGDVEILYNVGDFSPYVGIQYEYGFPEEGPGDDVLFLRGGIGYDVSDGLSINLDYQSEMLVDLVAIHQVGLNIRYGF